MDIERENRPDVLKRMAVVLDRENARLIAEVVRLRKEILELRNLPPEKVQAELDLLQQKLQAATEAAAEAAERTESSDQDDKPTREKKKHPGHGPQPQPALAIREVVHALDEADQTCGACGGHLEHFEGQDDTTEEIDVIERQFIIKKHIRLKYRCKCGCMEMPDLPPRLVPGGRYSNDFAIEVAAMKYVDQLPFDRIARIFGRESLVVESQTLWDQVEALARKLNPAWARLRDCALMEAVVGLDQTHWKVIGHKKSWQMWELSNPRIAYFTIAESKGTDDGIKILHGFKGAVVCDAFSTHGALARLSGVTLAHCWAHPRRMAEDTLSTDKARATTLIAFIRQLYDVEDEAGGDIEKLRALRATRSREVLTQLWKWRDEQRVLPSSPMGKLLAYLLNHKVGFERFLTDPGIPIDNNLTERGYLWPAIGRRSFVGSRSKRGTEVAAIFYSLAESARRNAIDPKGYLKTALDAALRGVVIPLPHELKSE